MKKHLNRLVLAAAVTGLFAGAATLPTISAADADGHAVTGKADAAKHACKGMNECKGQGGCKTDKNECKGHNSCKGTGGCATVKHECKGMNECKGQGGGAEKGKNECKGKGGCKVG